MWRDLSRLVDFGVPYQGFIQDFPFGGGGGE